MATGDDRPEPTIGRYDEIERPGPPPVMQEARPEKVKILSIALALAALGVFVGIVWYAYDQGRQVGSDAAAPLIKAPSKPVKIKPQDAGGMRVPDQDKLVLQDVDGAKVERVERLLPQPEEPLAPITPPITPPTAAKATDAAAPETADVTAPVQTLTLTTTPAVVSALKPALTPPPKVVKPLGTPVAQKSKPAAKKPESGTAETVAKAVTKPIAKPAAAKPAPKTTAVAKAAARNVPATKGKFKVQIAAVRSQQNAKAEWQRVQRKNPDVLSGLTLMTQKIDLGANKGIFYRIQAGPVSEAQAAKICQTLKSRKQACILVRP